MRQREIAKADRIRWLEAMPACLKPFADQTKDGRAMFGLAEAHSDESERVLVLFAWFGSGAGRWNGYPVYEQDAQDLLMTFPIEHLLTALDSSELIGARLEGAARFFASWEFRTKRGAELNRLLTLKGRFARPKNSWIRPGHLGCGSICCVIALS